MKNMDIRNLMKLVKKISILPLGCECLNGDTLKLDTFRNTKRLIFSTMINDRVLIQFVEILSPREADTTN
jgi:argininosuccinate lyase